VHGDEIFIKISQLSYKTVIKGYFIKLNIFVDTLIYSYEIINHLLHSRNSYNSYNGL
jgi:hypothetical protein